LTYINRISEALSPLVPVTVFAKDAHYAVPAIAKSHCNTIGLDWTIDPQKARTEANGKTLQGNADPCLLYADEKTIKTETEAMLRAFGSQQYIANLGHGLYPDLDKEKVKFFVNCIREFKTES
ncbi:MAG: uroporphyrinogen decarboxylase family protein, partial [Bacteroidia bacterium]